MPNLKHTNTGKQLIHEILATDKSKLIHSANSKKESPELKKNLHKPKSKPFIR
jgi:hypothetical protein